MPRGFAATWTRIAAHLAAALRLRGSTAIAAAGDAVISVSGRVEHAEGAARASAARHALASAAKSMDRARGALRRRDPDEAVDVATLVLRVGGSLTRLRG